MLYLCSVSAGVTSESSSDTLSLYAAEAVEFFRLDGHFSAKTDTARSTPDERDTVGVEGLVDGGSTGLSAGDGDTSRSFGEHLVFTALTKGFDNSCLHAEFDPVKGSEPNDVLQNQTSVNHGENCCADIELTQTQTIPIQPPEMASICVKPQLP